MGDAKHWAEDLDLVDIIDKGDRMVVLLRRLEHIPMPYTIPTCPVCREYVHSPHKPGCELDALLTEVGREG